MFDRDFFERLENEKLRSYFTEFNVETVSVWIITDKGEYCAWKLQDVEEGTLSFYYHDAEYTAHIPEKRQAPDREWAAPAAIVRYEDIREIHILPFGETLASRKSPHKEPSDLPIGFNAHIYRPRTKEQPLAAVDAPGVRDVADWRAPWLPSRPRS